MRSVHKTLLISGLAAVALGLATGVSMVKAGTAPASAAPSHAI